jgi:hypothetical protein
MRIKALVAGIAGSFAISTAAFAADVIVIPPPAPPPPVIVAPAGFGWGGLYLGGNIVAAISTGGSAFIGFSGQTGFNLVSGSLLFGGEFSVTAVTLGGPPLGPFVGFASGKAGFLLGATDNVLLYGIGGYAFPLSGGGGGAFLVGGGAAFGIGQSISVFVDALAVPVLAPGPVCCFVRAGVNFHFGN